MVCRKSLFYNNKAAAGFTLLELITALAVISVALAISVSLFGNNLQRSKELRNNRVAAEIAETQLSVLCAHPGEYVWSFDETGEDGLFPILPNENSTLAASGALLPDTILATKKAQDKTATLHRFFYWQAWGRIPSETADYLEVTLSVHWRLSGRPRMLALTSCVPRSLFQSLDQAKETEAGPQ